MSFGIPEKSLDMIKKAVARWPEIDKAVVFGSRAMGNYKKGSDVDLAIYGEKVTEEIVNKLSVLLNQELPLPYHFDIVHYESLSNQQLKEHIETQGRVVFCPCRGRR